MPKKKVIEEDYLYASARIKSLEVKNLNKERYEKMIDARNADEALAVLAECEYGDGFIADKIQSYEELLTRELMRVYAFMDSVMPDRQFVDVFRYQYDCQNLKSAIKSEFQEKSADSLFVALGKINAEQLKNALRDRNFELFPENMRAAAPEAIEAFARTKDPMLIDMIIDRAAYADIAANAMETNSDYLISLVKCRIDIINIMTAIRVTRLGSGIELLKKSLLTGGSLNENFFIEAFDGTEQKLFDELRNGNYSKLSDKAAAAGEKMKLGELEKVCEEIYYALIDATRYLPYGSAVVIAYLAGKESEIKNARIVMAGKSSGLSGDVIRERLRAVYA